MINPRPAAVTTCALILLTGCAAAPPPVPTNSQVVWDGTLLGLTPTLNTPAADRLRSQQSAAKKPLLHALDDPDRFAAAHVLLTEMFAKTWRVDSTQWNGLVVVISPDGTSTVDPSQLDDIRRKWKMFLAN